MSPSYIGAPLRRVEDRPLITGAGRYTDDLRLAGALHVHLVRSPDAHARVAALDVNAARRAPGVVRVLTGADVRQLGQAPVNPFFPDMKIAPHPLLADGVVRAVGEPVAAVVADTAAAARDAAEQVTAEYEPRPPVADADAALAPDAPQLYPGIPGNRAFAHTWRTGDVARAFGNAARVTRLRVMQQRLAAVTMEPRAVVAAYDATVDELTVWASTQAPFRFRAELAAILKFPENRIHVVAPDVGGGFGAKGAAYRDEALAAWLALGLKRAVRWAAARPEDVLTNWHGPGARASGQVPVDAGGRILGLRATIRYPLGPQMMVNAAGSARNHGRTLPGPYVVDAVEIEA